ncbi:MAG: penicillin-insensitive murein endopeptidase [Hyphomicrobiaceae bacterium]
MTKLSGRRPSRRRAWLVGVLTIVGLPLIGFCLWIAWLARESGEPSRCYGSVANGRLEGGRRLPYSGENYRAYSLVGFLAGRTFMHGSVRDAVIAAYGELHERHPELRFVYAETGWPWGGRFAPHRTHANGTSVDFHVPVRTLSGEVAELPASVFNKLGYSIAFDRAAQSGQYKIDFEALALHLQALDRATRQRGISIARVIFEPRLQSKLFATKAGARISRSMSFNKAPVWIPHDQHYHVDFNVPCR